MLTILSIDGGGMRGLMPARILNHLEQQMQSIAGDEGLRIADVFDFLVGTSTGGIMVSGYLKPNESGKRPAYSADDIEQFYRLNGSDIFDSDIFQKLTSGWGLTSPKYEAEGIESCMEKYFGDTLMSELLKPCLLTSYDLLKQKALYLCQHHVAHDFYVRDATRASACAPAYFPAAEIKALNGESFLCMDGGLFAYCPALIAYAEARRWNADVSAESMYILSLGTGHVEWQHSADEIRDWGIYEWSQVVNDVSCDSTSDNIDFQLKQMFREFPEQYHRFNPLMTGKPPAMDQADENSLDYFIQTADEYIEQNQSELTEVAHFLVTRHAQNKYSALFNRLEVPTAITRSSTKPARPKTIPLKAFQNLNVLLDNCFRAFAQRPAFNFEGHQLTYAQLRIHSDSFGAWLQEKGLFIGQRIALLMPTMLSYPVVFYGLMKAGVCAVNLNPNAAIDEIKGWLKQCKPKALVIEATLYQRLESAGVFSEAPFSNLLIIITDQQDGLNTSSAWPTLSLKKPKGDQPQDKVFHFKTILKTGASLSLHQIALKHHHFALTQYTAGTTDKPKAVLLSHRNLIASILQLKSVMSDTRAPLKAKCCLLAPLPLHHISGLMANILFGPFTGLLTLLTPDTDDNSVALEALAKDQVHTIIATNKQLHQWMDCKPFPHGGNQNLQCTLSVGGTLHKHTSERWHSHTNQHVLQAYGLTETAASVAVMPLNVDAFSNSVGRPLPVTKLVILDEFDRPQGVGIKGELCVKGPQVMAGYFDASLFKIHTSGSGAWLRTGDVAYIDDDGLLYIVDRLCDVFTVSDFKVYPSEVEAVLHTHPAIDDCCCVGMDDPNAATNDRLVAFIVFRSGFSAATEELQNFCQTQLEAHQIPQTFHTISTLPRSIMGRVQRNALIEP